MPTDKWVHTCGSRFLSDTMVTLFEWKWFISSLGNGCILISRHETLLRWFGKCYTPRRCYHSLFVVWTRSSQKEWEIDPANLGAFPLQLKWSNYLLRLCRPQATDERRFFSLLRREMTQRNLRLFTESCNWLRFAVACSVCRLEFCRPQATWYSTVFPITQRWIPGICRCSAIITCVS